MVAQVRRAGKSAGFIGAGSSGSSGSIDSLLQGALPDHSPRSVSGVCRLDAVLRSQAIRASGADLCERRTEKLFMPS
jgi:hypothetical protein